MSAIILTAHTLIVLGLIVVVLLQRSDGGALGLGGGSGGGFMSGRGAANALTRTTSILAAIFFTTSIGLAILAGTGPDDASIIEGLTGEAATVSSDPAELTAEDLLGTLGGADEPAAQTNEPAADSAPEAGAEQPASDEPPASDDDDTQ